jgi:hypothetical protein
VQVEVQNACEGFEVLVRRQDREAAPQSYGTHQKVGVRALQPLRATPVEAVGGLTVVRVHNRWNQDWTVLGTLSGWFFLLLGLVRMFAAGAYQRGSASTSATTFMVLEGILAILGLIMTFQAYRRNGK